RLLQRVAAELGPSTVAIAPADPRSKFSDILKLILKVLGVKNHGEDDSAMLRSCKFHLHGRMQKRQIVTLIFDNAQHAQESTLRELIENFLAAGPSVRDDHLLQIILAGRPQLKDKLTLAARRANQPLVPVICQLHPLEGLEPAAYLAQGLRATGLSPALFAPGAAVRIARCSRGNPGLINVLCHRALQLCGDRSSGSVTPELIGIAAADLNLQADESDEQKPPREAPSETADNFALGEIRIGEKASAEFQIGEKDTTEVVGQTFLQYNDAYDGSQWVRPRQRNAAWRKGLLILALVIGTSAWLGSETGKNQLDEWKQALAGVLFAHQPNNDQTNTAALATPKSGPAATSAPTEITPNPLPAPPDDPSDRPPTIQPSEISGKTPGASPTEILPESNNIASPRPAAKPKTDQTPALAPNSLRRSQELEGEVIQAIENRAIIGVTVSVVEDTAILEGQVASERQRSTAERAASSVNGIKRVRNRITVNYG
ncbi:MAG TPA: BON domain-containing protein, partial [Candidatus Binatus sp.]|nr:BON domain-containing protein [Candidatus Binatus sp.]